MLTIRYIQTLEGGKYGQLISISYAYMWIVMAPISPFIFLCFLLKIKVQIEKEDFYDHIDFNKKHRPDFDEKEKRYPMT